MPKISVVIPTLNEEKYLKFTLESFKKQTFTDFELVISDGGSKDKTLEIAKKYGAETIVVPHSNICLAREAGLKMGRGEIIVCADADTFYPENHLEEVAYEFKKDNHVVAVSGKAKLVNAPKWATFIWDLIYRTIEIVYKLTGIIIYVNAFNLAYKRKVFLELGGYNTKLDWGGDELDVLARIKKRGKIIYNSQLLPLTDGRRYNINFFTFLFKHLLYYYWLNYILAKIFGKSVISAKPVR